MKTRATTALITAALLIAGAGCSSSETSSPQTVPAPTATSHEGGALEFPTPAASTLEDWRNYADWVGVITVTDVTAAPTSSANAEKPTQVNESAVLKAEEVLFSRTELPEGLELATGRAWAVVPGEKPFEVPGEQLPVSFTRGGRYVVALIQGLPDGGTGELAVTGGPEWTVLGKTAVAPIDDGRIGTVQGASPVLSKAATTETLRKQITDTKPSAEVEKYADKTGLERFIYVNRSKVDITPPMSWPDPEGKPAG